MNAADLRPSHIATLICINSRQGTRADTIGLDYAAALADCGLITVRNGKCYSTAAGFAYGKESPAEVQKSQALARAAVRGAYGRARY